MSVPTLSVVIPAYNAASTIAGQLEALRAQEDAPSFEVIVADNRSTDGTASAALTSSAGLDLRVVSADRAQGVNVARNAGQAAARGGTVVFLDADDRAGPLTLRAFHNALDADAELGLVTGIPESADPQTFTLPIAQSHLPYGFGGFMAVRQTVFATVGGFDEDFRGGHDEVDFCWRAQHAGFGLGIAPEARFDYVPRATHRAAFRQYRRYGRTYIQLFAKHRDRGITGSTARAELRSLCGVPRSVWRILRDPVHRRENLEGLGWFLGRWQGHVRYRVWGPR